jgi:hypothetical protein
MSLEQGDANARLKLADPPADSRSLNAQQRSGSVKTPLLRRGQDLKQCIELNVPDHAGGLSEQASKRPYGNGCARSSTSAINPWRIMAGDARPNTGVWRFRHSALCPDPGDQSGEPDSSGRRQSLPKRRRAGLWQGLACEVGRSKLERQPKQERNLQDGAI